ncbi:WD40/YVTN/BNR-like repeat-containing protein [Oceanobacillus bengalensis]|uniref:Oxidoreductase n=1 Tax=Oceanobacillus bengalensis TaxID=1435466 RepID=A0A494YR89_9BACI|nr:oxidoreductase [Oceanobacillus bengalensis]RKQ11647.1 oxidoreductase [Oceanobacillus bengalensis]
MKKFILIFSTIIIIGLIFGISYYEMQGLNSFPRLNHSNITTNPSTREQPQVAPLHPVNNDSISYSLQNDELNITFNKGQDWVKVPVEKDLLFDGEYRGNKQTLIDDSYILTEDRAAFLYRQGAVVLKNSLDQGKTWKDVIITESFPVLRFRKVDFLNEQFGYVIISGDRTMSQEYSAAFLTHDGGETWEQTADLPTTRLISDGGFVDERTGFLSYGTINPEEPDLYVTQDSGNTWYKAVFHIPEQYDRIFVQTEVPVKEEDHLSVMVNQGPNGDYEGGRVKGKFISKDNGLTWDFSEEVHPNERI